MIFIVLHSSKKRNSLPIHLQNLKLPDGVQASNGVHWNTQQPPNSKSELHWPKKVPPHFKKIQVEQARSFFFGGVYSFFVEDIARSEYLEML